MILKGRKVILRAIERKDLELLVELVNDPEIENMIVGYAPPISYAQEEKWFEKNMGNTDTFRWIIETEKDGAVGMISLANFDWKNRVATLSGIRVSSIISEAGIALDAISTVFKYGFEELNLNRIEGGYLDDNRGAIVMNKLAGFKVEGVKREFIFKRGKYHDYICIAILKSDYDIMKKRKR